MAKILSKSIVSIHQCRTQVNISTLAAEIQLPGHGACITPQLYEPGLAERCIHVSDLDCVIGCRRVVRDEAILAGGSSGADVMAIDQAKDEIQRGATCVAIFPDRGERYLDTVYSDSWVTK